MVHGGHGKCKVVSRTYVCQVVSMVYTLHVYSLVNIRILLVGLVL